MSPTQTLTERQRDARIVPALGAYSIACFLLLPREWTFAGLAALTLFGFAFYYKTSIAKTGAIVALIGAILIAHSLAPPPPPQNLYFVFLAGAKLYILEFLITFGIAAALMVLDHGAAGEIKVNADTPWVWIVGGILLYFIFPFPYRLGYAACCPLVFAAYAGRNYYRIGAIGLMLLTTFWLGTQIKLTHNYILLGIVFWGSVAAAWYIRHTEKPLR
jgi:hypothetical protein